MTETNQTKRCDCGCMGAGPMFTEMLRRFGPSDTVSHHFKSAQIEVLKGLRALIDEQITARSQGPQHGTRITVE